MASSEFEPFEPTDQEARMLQIAGMPGYIMSERGVDLGRLSNYVSSTDGLKPLSVKKQEQLDDLNNVLDDPTHSPYVFCIASDPNDLPAKTLASIILLEAQRAKAKATWHTIIGGYKDEMRDKYWQHAKNDLIIFSNVTANDTDVKIEKLRDLLETYSDKPRIVTLTGQEPVAFFNAIGYPLHYSVWIRSVRLNRIP